jgi:polar amino acid transport system substrate-binding protein
LTFETNNDALMDLEAKRIDAVVADEILARYYISQKGKEKYKVLKDDFGSETYGVGVRKSDKALLDKLNKAFDDMKKD